MSDEMSYAMNEEVMNPVEAAEIKRRAAMLEGTRQWRFHIHADFRSSVLWANSPPLSMPGAIVFQQRDDGLVNTWTFL
jgi:hypothetical protein